MVDPGNVLARYVGVVDQLDGLLADLRDDQLDLASAPGKWSIRQIVHHIVDADDTTKILVKAALGATDCTVDLTWYDPRNTWANELAYSSRAIADAIAFLRTSRRHVAELLEHVPGAMDRTIRLTRPGVHDPRELTVRRLIEGQTAHGEHHLAQIRETRREHAID